MGSVLRTDEAAHRASSADCLDKIHNRHTTDRQSKAVSRHFGFVNESWERDSSQFSLWNRWLRANDISWRTRMSRVNPDMGGRGRQRGVQRNRSSTTSSCWLDRLPQSALQVPMWPVGVGCLHSLPCRQCVGSTRSRFVSCSVDANVFPSPCPAALADVVVSSTSLAIIELHVEETERRVGVLRRTGKQGDASRRT